MAKLTDDIKLKILADWKAGISQNQLAKKYDVSPATINKICKGIEQSNIHLVNAQVSVITELNSKSEYELNSINAEVNEKLKNKDLVYGVTQKALKKLDKLIDEIDSPADLKLAIEASDRASLTLKVNDRHAKSGDVNVNTQTNVGIQKITRKIID